MTFRIQSDDGDGEVVLSFQGELGKAGFAELERRIRERITKGKRVRVVLQTGTAVESWIVDELVAIHGISLQAESDFLCFWIEKARKQGKG